MAGKSVTFQGPFARFFIRANDARRPLNDAELGVARRVALELRFALASRDPEAVRVAVELDDAGLTELSGFGGDPLEALSERLLERLGEDLEQRLSSGALIAETEIIASLTERDSFPLPQLPPLAPPPASKAGEFSFEVRYVDEVGEPIAGLGVEFALGDELRSATTNGAGRALLEGVRTTHASVAVPELSELDKLLEGRAAHAARVARRADATQLARKRHEYFLAASGAPSAQEAVRVDAASQVGAQLAFDVARHTAVVRGAGLGQKRLEVSRDQPVERSRLRSPLFVVRRRGVCGVPHGRALANGVPAMNLRCSRLWRLANHWRAAASCQVPCSKTSSSSGRRRAAVQVTSPPGSLSHCPSAAQTQSIHVDSRRPAERRLRTHFAFSFTALARKVACRLR